MSSLRLKAPPCWACASASSPASRCDIVFSRRWRANSTSQRTASVRARRGIAFLLGLHAVLRARLLAVRGAGGVQRPAHDLVANAREVLDAAAADEHDRVLLEVVALAGDVGGDLHAVGQPHARDLAKS